MNLEQIKLSFFNYLQKTGKDDDYNLETSDDVDISLFVNNGEFKSYLSQDAKASATLSEEYGQGKMGTYAFSDFDEQILQDLQELEAQSEEVSEYSEGEDASAENVEVELPSDEVVASDASNAPSVSGSEVASDTLVSDRTSSRVNRNSANRADKKDSQEYSPYVKKTLDSMYKNQDVVDALDLDGDGVLNDEEKAQFEAYAQGYDEDAGKLTKKALDGALKDIKNGDFSYDNDPTKRAEALKKAEKLEKEEKAKEKDKTEDSSKASAAQSAGGSGGVGGSYGGGGVSGGASGLSASTAPVEKAPTVEELEEQKTAKESELKTAQDDVSAIYSGENPAVSAAQGEMDKAQQDYEKALEEDDKISEELKERAADNLAAIADQQSLVDQTNAQIAELGNQISAQQSVVTADESNLQALQASMTALEGQTSDDPEKQAEIQAMKNSLTKQITQATTQLENDKKTLSDLESSKSDAEALLVEQEAQLEDLNKEKEEIDKEILENCSEETKQALEAFNQAKENVETVKAQELETAQTKVNGIQKEIDELNAQINELKAKEIQKENSVSDFDFDFDVALSGVQENEMAAFKENWEKNQDKYKAVEDATGMPAELVAAIHWREGSGNFSTYLHNGDPLGQPTTHVPAGIYFETWEEAAIDAVTKHGGGPGAIDKNDIQTWYNYAEVYNGTGYRNKGVNSPYVWAGTSNYTSGKYVRDGVYDPNTVDQQLGVAVMLKELLS